MTPYLAADRTQVRVLIVDDDHDNRELLQIMLRWEGFLTSTAESGGEAIAAVEARPPHLVLVDLMMPDMDGNEVVRYLKGNALTSNILVMMVSAMNDRASRAAAIAAGADDFLPKPINRLELSERVKRLIESQPMMPVRVVGATAFDVALTK